MAQSQREIDIARSMGLSMESIFQYNQTEDTETQTKAQL